MDTETLTILDYDVVVRFKPDTILPDESTFVFTRTYRTGFFKKKTVTDTAIITIRGVVLSNFCFTDSELELLKKYVSDHRVSCYKEASGGVMIE